MGAAALSRGAGGNLVPPMARGWESKAVEAQQEAATAPAHRAMLEQTIAELDRLLETQ